MTTLLWPHLQTLKTFCSGGGNASARKAAVVAAGALVLFDAVLTSCQPHSIFNKELVDAATQAKLLVTSMTMPVGRATIILNKLPCSNPGCANAWTSRCGSCSAPYCSVNCQRVHWPAHKKECKARAAARSASGMQALSPDGVGLSPQQVRIPPAKITTYYSNPLHAPFSCCRKRVRKKLCVRPSVTLRHGSSAPWVRGGCKSSRRQSCHQPKEDRTLGSRGDPAGSLCKNIFVCELTMPLQCYRQGH